MSKTNPFGVAEVSHYSSGSDPIIVVENDVARCEVWIDRSVMVTRLDNGRSFVSFFTTDGVIDGPHGVLTDAEWEDLESRINQHPAIDSLWNEPPST